VRYLTVLAHREFRALFVAHTLSLLGDQLARIAFAILVYRRTGSALGASATFALSYLTYFIGGPLLSGLPDRYPRLTVMVVCDLVRAPLVGLLCLGDPPLWEVFAVIAALGVVSPPFDSARSALQPDVLDGEAYVVGNTLLNVTVQLSQIGGFVLGGALVAIASVRGTLALDAGTFLVSAGLLLHGVAHREAAQTTPGPLLADTLAGLRLVRATRELRTLLLLSVLGSVAIIATEGLAVPVAHDLGGGSRLAGLLTATSPIGFLVGSFVVLRLETARRLALLPLLVITGCLPLLLSPLTRSVPVLIALWVVAGVGGTVNLVAGPAFMQRCPREVRARAYGVAVTSLWVAQGLALLIAGLVAQVLTARQSVAAVAALTLVIAVPVLRAQGADLFVRDEGRR
jgi:MFS family permease